MRQAPWRERCRACAWWTSRPRDSFWHARPGAWLRRRHPRVHRRGLRVPLLWMARIERRFLRHPRDGRGHRTLPLLRLGLDGPNLDSRVRPGRGAPAHMRWFMTCSGRGAILYGGNFAVTRDGLASIAGFDRSIEFHGEDTNLGRRLTPLGRSSWRLSAGSGPRRDATTRWGSAGCSVCMSETSGRRSSAIVPRTMNILM